MSDGSDKAAILVPRSATVVGAQCEFCDQPVASVCPRCERRQCAFHTPSPDFRCWPCEIDYQKLVNADADARRHRTAWFVLAPVALGFVLMPFSIGWAFIAALLGPLVGLTLRGTAFRFRLSPREGFLAERKLPQIPVARARLLPPGEL